MATVYVVLYDDDSTELQAFADKKAAQDYAADAMREALPDDDRQEFDRILAEEGYDESESYYDDVSIPGMPRIRLDALTVGGDRDASRKATPDEVRRARQAYQSDDIEVDDDADVSITDEAGVWVQGWLWVDEFEHGAVVRDREAVDAPKVTVN